MALNMTHGMVKDMETQASVFGRRISELFEFSGFILILSLLSGVISSANASQIVQPFEDRSGPRSGLILEPRFTLYSTKENYNLTGTKAPLPLAGSLSRYYFELNGTYGVSDDFFIFARLSGLNSVVTSNLFVGGSASALGLSDQLVGAAYRLWTSNNGSSQTAQFDVLIPAYSNSQSRADGNPYLGDGSLDFTLGTFLDFALPISTAREYYLSLGAGFTKRSYGYSSALPWSLIFKRDPANGFYFAGGARGNISFKTDAATDNAVLLSQVVADQNRGAGGSYLTNAVNPAWMIAEANLGYRTEGGTLFFGRFATPISGTSIPVGLQLTAGVQFDFTSRSNSDDENEAPKRERRTEVVKPGAFQSYNLEASVTSTNDQLYLVKIDKGSSAGIEKGQIFDIFHVEVDALTQKKTEKRIARAKVTYVKDDESALNVLEYFIDSWIEVGFSARRLLK